MERVGVEEKSASSVSREEFLGDPIEALVILTDYDKAWPRRFEQIKLQLRNVLGSEALSIDHVGSTAVPGLPAKSVIDVQVSVPNLDDESAYRPAIESLGWPLRMRSQERRFFRPPKGKPRTVHIHVVEKDSEEERRHLLFTAYLRAHPEHREAYADLKRDLASRFEYRRDNYLKGKAAFIAELLRLAETWAEANAWDPGLKPDA